MTTPALILCLAFLAIFTLGNYDLARRLHRANRDKAELTKFNDRLCRRLVVLEKERVDYGIAPDDITALMDAVACDRLEDEFKGDLS